MTSLSMDSPPPRNPDQTGLGQRKGRRSTREKIERLVSESAKNYPAYLKLIYTGDSEHSSEEENNADSKCEAATVTVGCPSGAGQPSMKGVMSPESEKLLDPGKEKPMTPIEPSEGTDEDEGQTTAENSTGEVAFIDSLLHSPISPTHLFIVHQSTNPSIHSFGLRYSFIHSFIRLIMPPFIHPHPRPITN